MDEKREDMQFFGIFDIFQETYKIIYTWRKIFSQITLVFIHPLNFIFLAVMGSLNLLFSNFIHHLSLLNRNGDSLEYGNLSDLFSHKWTFFWPIHVFNIISFLIFSLLSNSAVVYTVASIYAGREVSCKQIMSVVSKIWKRLLVTFLSVFVAFVAYNLIAACALFFIFSTITLKFRTFGEINGSIFVVFFIFYFVGLLYLSIILQLSSVVSVLEDSYGFKAMAKSKSLLKGKMVAATIIFFMICLSPVIIVELDVHGGSFEIIGSVVSRLICLFLLLIFLLWKLVMETVLYFVCKSYHHENTDKLALSHHLEGYLVNDQLPMTTSKDVQL